MHLAAASLAAAEAHAKRRLDLDDTIRTTSDDDRWKLYFNLTLAQAGVALSRATEAAIEDLKAYHAVHNLWETVPDDVPAALERMRARGLRLVVVSNANGTLRTAFDRLGLTGLGDLLPIGNGLLTFTTLEEAADAARAIEHDYERHARGARRLAERCFDSAHVLTALARNLGLN